MRMLLYPLASLIAALGLVSAGPALADPRAQVAVSSETDPLAAPLAHASPALWQVADADTTIYLFGTIHALPGGIQWFEGPVKSALEGSRELVTEIAEPDPGAMTAIVLTKATLPRRKTLRRMMSAQDRTNYEAALKDLGQPPAMFDMFEPWYAAIGLSTLPLMRDGFSNALGVEQVLETRAKTLGLHRGALETPEFQLGLFDSLPGAVQQRYLRQVVTQLPTVKPHLMAMVEAWKRGDADALAELINREQDDPVLLRTLLTDRNRTWSDWISRKLDSPGSVFLAVGAGHLAGKDSVLELLKARGLAVQRLQ
jgi:uncharacterized protein YbaP (TraB family)